MNIIFFRPDTISDSFFFNEYLFFFLESLKHIVAFFAVYFLQSNRLDTIYSCRLYSLQDIHGHAEICREILFNTQRSLDRQFSEKLLLHIKSLTETAVCQMRLLVLVISKSNYKL